MKKPTVYKKIICVLFGLNILFIWLNSSLDSAHTYFFSDKVYYRIQEIVDEKNNDSLLTSSSGSSSASAGVASGGVSGAPSSDSGKRPNEKLSDLVRKFAHVIEFSVLGVFTVLLLVNSKITLYKLQNILSIGFFVAFTDETIQIFSHRTSSVKDVWIDMAGFAVGALIAIAVKSVVNINKQRGKTRVFE